MQELKKSGKLVYQALFLLIQFHLNLFVRVYWKYHFQMQGPPEYLLSLDLDNHLLCLRKGVRSMEYEVRSMK